MDRENTGTSTQEPEPAPLSRTCSTLNQEEKSKPITIPTNYDMWRNQTVLLDTPPVIHQPRRKLNQFKERATIDFTVCESVKATVVQTTLCKNLSNHVDVLSFAWKKDFMLLQIHVEMRVGGLAITQLAAYADKCAVALPVTTTVISSWTSGQYDERTRLC